MADSTIELNASWDQLYAKLGALCPIVRDLERRMPDEYTQYVARRAALVNAATSVDALQAQTHQAYTENMDMYNKMQDQSAHLAIARPIDIIPPPCSLVSSTHLVQKIHQTTPTLSSYAFNTTLLDIWEQNLGVHELSKYAKRTWGQPSHDSVSPRWMLAVSPRGILNKHAFDVRPDRD